MAAAVGTTNLRQLPRTVKMERATFRKQDGEKCSCCFNGMGEGVRCTLHGGQQFFVICGACVTAMGIVLGS